MTEPMWHFAGYFFGTVLAALPIYFISNRMWDMVRHEGYGLPPQPPARGSRISDTFIRFGWQAITVGLTERALYIASLELGRPEFIAVWLTLKTVARSRRWTSDRTVPGRAIYNNFLVGNALSIGFALVSAAAIGWATAPPKARDITLSWAVPAVTFFSTWVLYLFLVIWHRQILSRNRRLGISVDR